MKLDHDVLRDVRHLLMPTGSRYDHAHFRYDRSKIRILNAHNYQTTQHKTLKLNMRVGLNDLYVGYEGQGRQHFRFRFTDAQSFRVPYF